MGRLSELDHDLQTIRAIMGDGEPTTIKELAEDQIARELTAMIARMDEFCGMALNPETADLIEREAIAFGQLLTRVQLVGGFINARKSHLKVVK